MNILLTRDPHQPSQECTLGTLDIAGRQFHTLERDALPVGDYRLEHHRTPSGEQCFSLIAPKLGVYGYPYEIPAHKRATARSHALVRAGDFWWDCHGGIAVGKGRALETVSGFTGIVRAWKMLDTKSAMNEIRTLIGHRIDITLTLCGSYQEAQAAG